MTIVVNAATRGMALSSSTQLSIYKRDEQVIISLY